MAAGFVVLAIGLAVVLSGGQRRPAPRQPDGAGAAQRRPPAPPSEAGSAIGVSLNLVFNTPGFTDRMVTQQIGAARQAGVRLARSDAFWEATEPAPPRGGIHSYDWRFDDRVASFLAQAGIAWRPIVDYSPRWAASDPSAEHSPPSSDAEYAAYAAAFARRYGRGGEWWRGQPRLPYLPVTTYELWNEENTTAFWGPTAPDPRRYADLYRRARAAIRRVDPRAKVIVGGLAEPASPFIAAMLAARPALRGAIDGVGVHPYAETPDAVLANVRVLRQRLDALHESRVPIHVTEIGWVTSPKSSAKYAPPDVKAANIVTTLGKLADSDCGIATVVLYTWTSPERAPAAEDDWYGIYHPGGGQTPSGTAFATLLRAHSTNPAKPALRVCHP
jgi:hypothetical protein